MGNVNEQLNDNNIDQFAFQNQIDAQKLRNMLQNFKALDVNHKGYITKNDLINSLDINSSDKNFLQGVLDQFVEGSKEEINLAKLVKILSSFEKDKKQNKLQFLFDMLDSDQDGYLTLEDLERGFRQVQLPHLKQEDLKEIAIQTLNYADKKRTGKLDFEEFETFFSSTIHLSV